MTTVFEGDDYVTVKIDEQPVTVYYDNLTSAILVSPNGTRYAVRVANDGTLYTQML